MIIRAYRGIISGPTSFQPKPLLPCPRTLCHHSFRRWSRLHLIEKETNRNLIHIQSLHGLVPKAIDPRPWIQGFTALNPRHSIGHWIQGLRVKALDSGPWIQGHGSSALDQGTSIPTLGSKALDLGPWKPWTEALRLGSKVLKLELFNDRNHTIISFAILSSASNTRYTSYASLGAAIINTAVGPNTAVEIR